MSSAFVRGSHLGGALLVGLPAPFVFFVAASAFEPSTAGEMAAGLGFGLIYLAFAQFWVVPRHLVTSGAAWPTILAAAAPLGGSVVLVGLLENPAALWELGLPCTVASVAGGWLGAWLGQCAGRPTSAPSRSAHARRTLYVPALMLLALTVGALLAGVIPAVASGNPRPGFNLDANLTLFRVEAFVALLGVFGLAVAVRDARSPAPKPLLAAIAIVALLLAFIHAGMGGLCSHYGLSRAAAILWGGCVAQIAVAGLLTIDAVLDDHHFNVAHHPATPMVRPSHQSGA